MPGVDSALYISADAPYTVRNAYILAQMKHLPPVRRGASFVCAAACVLPGGGLLTSTGLLAGQIAPAPAGQGGFGYDPIFYLPERGLTMAQLSVEEKNTISHRGQAMSQMKILLEAEMTTCGY
jgi:XTP/dITP diphosphohydrolase